MNVDERVEDLVKEALEGARDDGLDGMVAFDADTDTLLVMAQGEVAQRLLLLVHGFLQARAQKVGGDVIPLVPGGEA